jgi:protein phosphatase
MARRQNVEPEELQGLRSNIIIRSLGPDALVQVDVEGPHPIEPGDIFLICSDGLSGPVQDTEIGAIASMMPPEEACKFLVQLANLRGGPDNITVQIVRVAGPDEIDLGTNKRPRNSLVQRIHWSLPTLIAGLLLLVCAFLLVSVDLRQVGMFLFIPALFANIAGIVGLISLFHADKKRREMEPPPPNINIYRQTSCAVDRSVVEKLARSTVSLVERMTEGNANTIPTAYQKHYQQGEEWLKKNNIPEAFREFSRALYVLAVAHNSQKNKLESFRPLFGEFTEEE